MREILTDHFTDEIWDRHREFVADIAEEMNETINTKDILREKIRGDDKEGYFKFNTPPFLIKNVGLAKELFVYYKFISDDLGYLMPTLLYQRIFKGIYKSLTNENYKLILTDVPDFLFIKGGRIRGIEVGREKRYFKTRKAALVTGFSGACGIPTTNLNILLGNPIINKWFDLGYKCNKCYRSFRLCEAFINGEIGEGDKFYEVAKEKLTCDNFCSKEKINNCKDAVIFTKKLKNYITDRENQKLVYHQCVTDDERDEKIITVPLIPKIENMDVLLTGLQ